MKITKRDEKQTKKLKSSLQALELHSAEQLLSSLAHSLVKCTLRRSRLSVKFDSNGRICY